MTPVLENLGNKTIFRLPEHSLMKIFSMATTLTRLAKAVLMSIRNAYSQEKLRQTIFEILLLTVAQNLSFVQMDSAKQQNVRISRPKAGEENKTTFFLRPIPR